MMKYFVSVALFVSISAFANDVTKVSLAPGSNTSITLSEKFVTGDTISISCSEGNQSLRYFCTHHFNNSRYQELRFGTIDKSISVDSYEDTDDCLKAANLGNAAL